MRYPKLREIKEAVKSLFSKPYTLKFPKEPSVPFKEFRGAPRFDKDDCVGCGACAQVCPPQAIEIVDDKATKTRTLKVRHDTCIYCGQCQAYCLTEKLPAGISPLVISISRPIFALLPARIEIQTSDSLPRSR